MRPFDLWWLIYYAYQCSFYRTFFFHSVILSFLTYYRNLFGLNFMFTFFSVVCIFLNHRFFNLTLLFFFFSFLSFLCLLSFIWYLRFIKLNGSTDMWFWHAFVRFSHSPLFAPDWAKVSYYVSTCSQRRATAYNHYSDQEVQPSYSFEWSPLVLLEIQLLLLKSSLFYKFSPFSGFFLPYHCVFHNLTFP